MRDKRFITEHRGGPLKKEQHVQLMKWACSCSKHVLYLFVAKTDEGLINALAIGERWAEGNATVGETRNASVTAHAFARKSSNKVAIAVARSVGHAVATAHMADHSLGAAWYALKAAQKAGLSVDDEIKWQNQQLPSEIKELVLTARKAGRFKKI